MKKYRKIPAHLNVYFLPHWPPYMAFRGQKLELWVPKWLCDTSLAPMLSDKLPFSPALHSWRRMEAPILCHTYFGTQIIFFQGDNEGNQEIWNEGIKLLMCSHCPEFFTDFFNYSKSAENCTKSTVYGRKNENLCHLTVLPQFI